MKPAAEGIRVARCSRRRLPRNDKKAAPMTSVRTETETVIKRILPYLRRRGYDPEVDIDFETQVQDPERYARGYVDLLVNCGNVNPLFVIEAKRNGKRQI